MKNIVQGNSAYGCECRKKLFSCSLRHVEDSDYKVASDFRRNLFDSTHWLLVVRNEHVPLKGCVVVKKFERSSIIYYT